MVRAHLVGHVPRAESAVDGNLLAELVGALHPVLQCGQPRHTGLATEDVGERHTDVESRPLGVRLEHGGELVQVVVGVRVGDLNRHPRHVGPQVVLVLELVGTSGRPHALVERIHTLVLVAHGEPGRLAAAELHVLQHVEVGVQVAGVLGLLPHGHDGLALIQRGIVGVVEPAPREASVEAQAPAQAVGFEVEAEALAAFGVVHRTLVEVVPGQLGGVEIRELHPELAGSLERLHPQAGVQHPVVGVVQTDDVVEAHDAASVRHPHLRVDAGHGPQGRGRSASPKSADQVALIARADVSQRHVQLLGAVLEVIVREVDLVGVLALFSEAEGVLLVVEPEKERVQAHLESGVHLLDLEADLAVQVAGNREVGARVGLLPFPGLALEGDVQLGRDFARLEAQGTFHSEGLGGHLVPGACGVDQVDGDRAVTGRQLDEPGRQQQAGARRSEEPGKVGGADEHGNALVLGVEGTAERELDGRVTGDEALRRDVGPHREVLGRQGRGPDQQGGADPDQMTSELENSTRGHASARTPHRNPPTHLTPTRGDPVSAEPLTYVNRARRALGGARPPACTPSASQRPLQHGHRNGVAHVARSVDRHDPETLRSDREPFDGQIPRSVRLAL